MEPKIWLWTSVLQSVVYSEVTPVCKSILKYVLAVEAIYGKESEACRNISNMSSECGKMAKQNRLDASLEFPSLSFEIPSLLSFCYITYHRVHSILCVGYRTNL